MGRVQRKSLTLQIQKSVKSFDEIVAAGSMPSKT